MRSSAALSTNDGLENLMGFSPMLYRYALSRVGNASTAEDLVQDTLLVACTKASEFAAQANASAWLVGILRHKVLDHYRWKQRHPGDLPPSGHALADAGEEPWFAANGAWRLDPNAGLEALDADPSTQLERARMRSALEACIHRLPRSLKRVFVLRELEGLETEATCMATGLTTATVSVTLHRARQMLRACMQKFFGKAP